MDSQEPFRVTHLLGPLVGVAHYGTVHHPLQEYCGSFTAVSSSQEAGSIALAATTTTTLAHCLPQTPQTSRTLTCGVALTPQAAHPQVQYYCEATEPMLPCPQIRHSTNTNTLLPQPASATPPEPHLSPTLLPRTKEARLGPGEQQGRRAPGAMGSSTRLSRKRCRNSGRAYISTTGKAVPAKRYLEQDCECRHKCLARLGTTADREAAYRRFWDIGDFEKQNVHLVQSVVLVPSSNSSRVRHLDPPQGERRFKTVKRIYYVKIKEGQARVRVCKSQFLRLHGVSNGRLDRVLQSLHCAHPHGLQDRRGQHTPGNKTAPEDVELAEQHILKVRQQGVGAFEGIDTHGSKGASVKRMHELYQRWCVAQSRTPVSLWVYRQVGKASLTPQEGRQGQGGTARGSTQVGEEEKKLKAAAVVVGGHSNIQEAMPGLPVITNNTTTSATTTTTNTTTTNTTVTSNLAPTTSIDYEFAITTSTGANTTMTTTSSDISPAIPSSTTSAMLPTITTAICASISTTTATALEALKQKSRRKKRRLREVDRASTSMSRAERKARRNKGEAYVTSSGEVHSRKIYQDKPCGCRHRCIPALGTPQARRQVFDNFWGLASFTRQNAYIARMVALAPLGRRRTSAPPARTCSRVYSVQFKAGGEMLRVCKVAFLCLHGISNGRLDRVLQAVAGQSPCALKDRRGRHSPKNKTQEEDARHVLGHICTFSLDDSGQPNRHGQPLQNLSVEKMYHLYREQCVSENRKPVGSFVYRKILKERYRPGVEEAQ